MIPLSNAIKECLHRSPHILATAPLNIKNITHHSIYTISGISQYHIPLLPLSLRSSRPLVAPTTFHSPFISQLAYESLQLQREEREEQLHDSSFPSHMRLELGSVHLPNIASDSRPFDPSEFCITTNSNIIRYIIR